MSCESPFSLGPPSSSKRKADAAACYHKHTGLCKLAEDETIMYPSISLSKIRFLFENYYGKNI